MKRQRKKVELKKTPRRPSGRIFKKLRNKISQIPKGKVSTYGLIARACGIKDARQAGWAIWGNKNPKIPCHRVVSQQGFLAEKFSLGGLLEQKKRLEKENIKFLGKNRVDLKKHLFIPKIDTAGV